MGLKKEYLLNMGPQHPSTHGVLRILLDLDGERVNSAEVKLGYAHRGIEKMAEFRTIAQFSPIMDRVDYVSSVIYEWGLVGACEKALGVEVPKRAEYIRVIMSELQRISSHFLWIGAFLLDLGAFTPFLWVFDAREKILDMFELVSGSRMMPNYVVVGGVRRDIPPELDGMIRDFISYTRERMDDLDVLVTENVIFIKRTKGVGVITEDMVYRYSLTGPVARGSGVPLDVRSNEPYSVYGELGFEPVVFDGGDCFSRYMVRVGEVRRSLELIEKAMEGLPEGDVKTKVPKVIKIPEGRFYNAVESARGLLGVYLVGNGDQRPYRLKLRVPSFSNIFVIEELLKGVLISDIVAILGSIDVVVPEIER